MQELPKPPPKGTFRTPFRLGLTSLGTWRSKVAIYSAQESKLLCPSWSYLTNAQNLLLCLFRASLDLFSILVENTFFEISLYISFVLDNQQDALAYSFQKYFNPSFAIPQLFRTSMFLNFLIRKVIETVSLLVEILLSHQCTIWQRHALLQNLLSISVTKGRIKFVLLILIVTVNLQPRLRDLFQIW